MRPWSRVGHRECMEVRGQSVLLPCGFLELSSGHHAWWHPGHQVWWQVLSRGVSFSWLQGFPHRLQAMGMQGRGRREWCRMPRFFSWIFPSPAWLERGWGEPEGRGLSGNLFPHPKLLAIFYLECVFTPGWGKTFQGAPTSLTPWGSKQLEWKFFIKCPSIKPFPRKWNTAWSQLTAFSTNNEHCGEQVLYLNDFPPAFCQVCLSRRPTLLCWGLLPLWPSGLE